MCKCRPDTAHVGCAQGLGDTAALIARCMELEADNARLRMERADAAEDRVGQQLGQAKERARGLEAVPGRLQSRIVAVQTMPTR